MKLSKRRMLMISFMLFSLFFGAGNLIFPPFLGQSAGTKTLPAMIGFLITAVLLPVLGVITVAKFGGLERLAEHVGTRFSLVFTSLIYLSIGPGIGIPRAASVPFEMAVAPYLPQGLNLKICMVGYSAVFFLIVIWLCLNPSKLVSRIGVFITPSLLVLMCLLFITFLFQGLVNFSNPKEAYASAPFLQGFSEGYQTMDTIAALNFGLVITTTLNSFGIKDRKSNLRYTIWAGALAGSVLALVYIMLTYMGMCSSGIYPLQENGAWTLRCIVYQLFGDVGAILLVSIFTLACLTTCVGLVNSISQYFSSIFKIFTYRQWVYSIVGGAFFTCNLGLNAILSISVPVLNAMYPISIVLILLGIFHNKWETNRYIYPLTILGTGCISILYALESIGIRFGFLSTLSKLLPLYSRGFSWVFVAMAMMFLSFIFNWAKERNKVSLNIKN